MAMIICPNCGEQVSERAKKCVHCGTMLIQEENRICAECGTQLEEGVTECPNCGCPIDDVSVLDGQDKPQKVEVTGVKVAKKVKVIIGIIVALVLVGGVTVFGVNQYQNKKAAEEYAQRVKEYADNLELATYSMLSGASEAETCGNLIKQVWYNAIYEERDGETDRYTRPNGYFVSDFNDALGNLFIDTSFQSKIRSIEENQKTVASLMKELKNPPEEYKDAYEAISELYGAYLSLTNLATDPSGSLQTFSSNFNDADTETLNCYKAMKLYLDE